MGDEEALVASGEGNSIVDVTVAGEATRGGISLACKVSRSLFVEGDARVAGGKLVGGMDLGTSCDAEKGRVRAAVADLLESQRLEAMVVVEVVSPSRFASSLSTPSYQGELQDAYILYHKRGCKC